MHTSFWIRCAAVGASLTLLGAGCSSTDSTSTTTPSTSGNATTETGTTAQVQVNADGTATVTTDAGSTTVQTATVTITGDGFSPSSLTIKKGTQVTFINKGSTAHWPASDPHPTHTDYPEFDPKHELKSGESWTFTFDKVGAWRYHDHLNSGEKGIITVTE